MKQLLIASACVLAISTGSVLAAENDYRGKKPVDGDRKERMERMREHLDLSDAQVEQIKEIRANGGSREDVAGVLTDDQRAKLKEAREKHGGKHRQPAPEQS